jgi:uncharacterized membrane protein YeaQ/YmgE (transglycosylase-associated protein family)
VRPLATVSEVWVDFAPGIIRWHNGVLPKIGDVRVLYALVFWIIVGLIAGALARAIMPGDDPGGILVTIIIGIVGAVVGGWLLSLLGIGGAATGAWIWSIVSGIIGAVILLAIYRALSGRRV